MGLFTIEIRKAVSGDGWIAQFPLRQPAAVVGCPVGEGRSVSDAVMNLLRRTNRESGTSFDLDDVRIPVHHWLAEALDDAIEAYEQGNIRCPSEHIAAMRDELAAARTAARGE